MAATRTSSAEEAYDRFTVAWERASLASVRDGLSWYARAAQAVLQAAREGLGCTPWSPTELGVARAMAVCAVLSPRLPWAKNVRDVTLAFRGPAFRPAMCSLGANRDKAYRILAAPPGAPWQEEVRGRKVWAFYQCLCGRTDAVCLDAHMFRLAGLDPERITPGRYQATADALRALAAEVSVPPRDLQAILWCHQRGKGD